MLALYCSSSGLIQFFLYWLVLDEFFIMLKRNGSKRWNEFMGICMFILIFKFLSFDILYG